jgi:hypothetical protein
MLDRPNAPQELAASVTQKAQPIAGYSKWRDGIFERVQVRGIRKFPQV